MTEPECPYCDERCTYVCEMEQSKMTKADDVPENALSAVRTAKLVMSGDVVSLAPAGWKIVAGALDAAEAALRAHEPAPVDPAMDLAEQINGWLTGRPQWTNAELAEFLRARLTNAGTMKGE